MEHSSARPTPTACRQRPGQSCSRAFHPSRGSNQPPQPPPGAVSTQPLLPSTITISGAGFTDSTQVEFIAADGTVYPTTNKKVISLQTMTVDLDVFNMPAGYYDVRGHEGIHDDHTSRRRSS